MKAKNRRQRALHARLVRVLTDASAGHYGKGVQAYVDQYLKLKALSFRLEAQGLKVKIALPDLHRRPLLIISR